MHILRKEIASFRRRSSGSVPRTHSGVKERLPSAVSQVEKATRGMCCPRGPSHITLSIDLSFSKIWGIFSPNYHIILFPLKFHLMQVVLVSQVIALTRHTCVKNSSVDGFVTHQEPVNNNGWKVIIECQLIRHELSLV